MSPSQPAPGAEMVAVPGRGLAVRTADGGFLTVRTGDADEDALLGRLAGTVTGPEADRPVRAFDSAGCLTADQGTSAWLSGPLTAHLRAAGAEPRPGNPEDPAAGPPAVVWCPNGPVPEGLRDAADRLPARAGWWAAHGDRRDSDGAALDKARALDPGLLTHLPLTGPPRRLGRALPSWPGTRQHRERGRLIARAAGARVPLLAVGGRHDRFTEDTAAPWRHGNGPSARLLLDPWGHGLVTALARARSAEEPGPDTPAGPGPRRPRPGPGTTTDEERTS
ncbi:hypothetical protein SUDANB15_00729 [Streptomyces sp. enrichment culture]|uniref:hypothetical protein n=1 Tax=Streptomyces sp. enrichment culture TaxID=1795815 RepID=UPI003F5555DD